MALEHPVPEEELRQSIVENDFPQFHQKENVIVPRVSSVLKLHRKGLHQKLHFTKNHPQFLRFVDQSCIEGNHIHNRIKDLLLGHKQERESLSLVEQEKVQRFQRWAGAHVMQLLTQPETTLVSQKQGFAGTPDIICRIKKKNYVIDIKTGHDIHEPNWLQVESYRLLIHELLGLKIDKVAVLSLGRNTSSGYHLAISDPNCKRIEEFQQMVQQWHQMFPQPFGNIHDVDTDAIHAMHLSV